jgi:hypothetical protein
MTPIVTEYYGRMVDNYVENVVSFTNLANTLAMVNMENIQQFTETNREFWRVEIENSKAISRSLREP